jgi:hypothetical protein
MKKMNSIEIRLCESLRQTLSQINIIHSFAPSKGVKEFEDIIQHSLRNYGYKESMRLFKSYRLIINQFATKQVVVPIPFCKADKDGFPKVLKPWKINSNSPVDEIRYVMSVWRILDTFRCEPEYKVSTIITQTEPDKSLICEITDFIKSWQGMKLLGSKPSKGYLIMSNRAGPNGPASVSCLEDLKPLRESKELYNSVKKLLRISVPGLNIDTYEAPTSGRTHSKLVLLSDKACKTRVVAIADWWSNVALSGIHKSFMNALSKLDTDVTYRQDQIPKLIKGLGNCLYSADMTAFTDCFPRELEKNLINAAWPGIGDLWEQVISNRSFTHPKGDVKYATGNPMGCLSSWPVSSFTHHAVKSWCAHKLGKTKYKYLVLGDDCLDSDIEVHKLYLDTITKLGVSVSLSKCTSSESACAEFAKRHFTHGVEVTGLPVDLLQELPNKPEQFIELIRICRERGYKDSSLAPGIQVLVSKNKSSKILSDVLALPQVVSGIPPLLGAKPDGHIAKLLQLEEDTIKDLSLIAKESEFMELVSELEKAQRSVSHIGKSKVHIPENHPILVAISDKLMSYMETGSDDEYSIYNSWMKGEYREMAHVPNIDAYRVRNKGHFVTRCKYNIMKKTVALANGNCNIPLQDFAKVSNWDLFQRGYPKE